jgi:hypothetical protein
VPWEVTCRESSQDNHSKLSNNPDYLTGISRHPKRLSVFALPSGIHKYEYQSPPIGVVSSPGKFLETISSLLQDLENVPAYIDDLLMITRGSCEDHEDKVKVALRETSTTRT